MKIYMTDEEVRTAAIEFAKKNKVRIAKELTDPIKYIPSAKPISVFMAGSPGAGKTEYSKELIEILEKDNDWRFIRIDSDDIRSYFRGYTGGNSHLFNGAASLIVEKMHDLVLHRNQHFILDGTFSHYDKAVKNIQRSINKKRPVFVFYVYQEPEIAWKFTEAREKMEGRNIPKMAFIERFIGARETVEKIRNEFGEKVSVILVKKNIENNTVEELVEITLGSGAFDNYIEKRYTQEDLEKRI